MQNKFTIMPEYFNQPYNCGGWLISKNLLKKRVAEGVASNPLDFNYHSIARIYVVSVLS